MFIKLLKEYIVLSLYYYLCLNFSSKTTKCPFKFLYNVSPLICFFLSSPSYSSLISLLFQAPPSSPPTSNVLSPCWAPLSWHSDGSYHFHQPCLSPCLSDVKYHPFTQLHLIFSRPSLSPSYLPSHFSHHLWQPSLSAEVCTCFLLSPLVFFNPLPLFLSLLNEPFRARQSSASPPYPSEHRKNGRMVTDGFVQEALSV